MRLPVRLWVSEHGNLGAAGRAHLGTLTYEGVDVMPLREEMKMHLLYVLSRPPVGAQDVSVPLEPQVINDTARGEENGRKIRDVGPLTELDQGPDRVLGHNQHVSRPRRLRVIERNDLLRL